MARLLEAIGTRPRAMAASPVRHSYRQPWTMRLAQLVMVGILLPAAASHTAAQTNTGEISTGGQYTAMGDPTVFTTRDNQHFELYDNFTIDRGAHHVKFGAYYFHLPLRPLQPDNARGAFSYTGQFNGDAFADFLLGYPTSATSGIGRGDESGRTSWLYLYAQDDWQARRNLTVNLGLRYEYNQHMSDVTNRLPSVDLSTPGGRFAQTSTSPTGSSAIRTSAASSARRTPARCRWHPRRVLTFH